jgi:adenylylsulfate kinase
MVIWLTGLPGSGKTTLSKALYNDLIDNKIQSVLLDGDSLRSALNNFEYDRESRIQLALTYSRLAEMFRLKGQIAVVATVSMFDCVREWNRKNIADYKEIYIKASMDTLMQRNQKQLYSNATNGLAENVHTFDLEVEEPKTPDLILNNEQGVSVEMLSKQLIDFVKREINL